MSISFRKGLTLVELIMAIVVMAIVMPGVLFLFIEVMSDAHVTPPMVTATALAREKLEQIRADLANPAVGYAGLTAANYPAESPVAGFTNFTRGVTFTEVSSTDLATAQSGSGYKKVVVKVDWNGGQRSVVLTGLATAP